MGNANKKKMKKIMSSQGKKMLFELTARYKEQIYQRSSSPQIEGLPRERWSVGGCVMKEAFKKIKSAVRLHASNYTAIFYALAFLCPLINFGRQKLCECVCEEATRRVYVWKSMAHANMNYRPPLEKNCMHVRREWTRGWLCGGLLLPPSSERAMMMT